MDPLSLYELAESQKKSVRELTTGEPGMSAHELCVMWPAYRRVQAELAEEASAPSERLEDVI